MPQSKHNAASFLTRLGRVFLAVLFFSFYTLTPIASAVSTGTGSEKFPIGTDADDDFNVAAGKFVVRGADGNVGVGTFLPDATVELIRNGSGAPLMISNIPTSNGDLFVVTSAGNVGVGTSTPAGAFSVLSGNVGVGTVSPNALLAVGTSSQFQVNAAGAIAAVTGITTTGGYSQTGTGLNVLSGNVGLGTNTPVGGLAVMTGNVGIGTWSPVSGLEVKGSTARVWTGAGTNTNANAAGELYVEGDLEVDGSIYGDGTNITGAVQNGGGWFDGGANIFLATTTDNVAIGTTLPTASLLIENTGTVDSFRVNDALLDPSPFIIDAVGNFGVGTTAPRTKLEFFDAASFTTRLSVTTNNNYPTLGLYGSPAGGGQIFGAIDFAFNSNNGLEARIVGYRDGNGGALAFATTPTSGGSNIERMRITEAGAVGVGTSIPGARFSVLGNAAIGSSAYAVNVSNTNNGLIVEGNVGIGTFESRGSLVVASGNVGLGTLDPVGGLTVMSGNVGVGTWSPTAGFEVKGSAAKIWTGVGINTNAASAGELYVEGDLEVDGSIYGDGTNITGAVQNGGGWFDGGANIFLATTTDNVAIGTTLPTASLLVENIGTVDSLRINDAAGDTTPLVINADGNIGIGTTTAQERFVISSGNVGIGTFTPVGGTVFMNGNVGIGTWVPGESLDIRSGNIRFSNNQYIGSDALQNAFFTSANSHLRSAGSAYVNIDDNNNQTDQFFAVTRDDLTTGGAELFRVQEDGAVGIGTTTPVGGLSVMSGNVGLGTWSPREMLELNGRFLLGSTSAPVVTTNKLYSVTGNLFWNGTQLDTGATASGWTDGGAVIYELDTTDFVGIGTINPTTTFEIVKQSTNPPLMISSVATGDGDYLMITSSGNIGIGTINPQALLATGAGNVGIGTIYPVNGTALMNGNVGIGTWSPNAALHIRGELGPLGQIYSRSISTDSYIVVDGPAANEAGYKIFSNGAELWEILRDNSSTTLSFWNPTAGFLMNLTTGGRVGIGTGNPAATFAVNGGGYFAGNVGIGTFYPSSGGILDVRQDEVRIWDGTGTDTNATGAGELYVQGDLEVDGTIYGDGSGITGAVQNGGGWFDGGTNVFLSATSDNVAIGTTVPTSTLLVENITAINSLRVNDSAQDPSPFIVDANGNVGIGTTTVNGSLIIPLGNVGLGTLDPVGGLVVMNGNVGIGTWSPTARLAVATGNVLVSSGNLGIGGAPTSQLFVQGTGSGSEVTVNHTSTVDLTLPVISFSGSSSNISGAGVVSASNVVLSRNVTTAAAGTGVAVTGHAESIPDAMTMFVGTSSITGQSLNIARTVSNFNPAITTVSGAVMSVTDTASLIGGTLTHTADTVDIQQSYTSGSGTALNVSNAGTGLTMRFNDDGTYTDSTPFIVDAAGNVGLGTTDTGTAKLAVLGGAVGFGTTSPVGGLAVMNGNVGIGTWSPTGGLEVKGSAVKFWTGSGTNTNATAAGELYVEGDLEVDGTIYGDGSGITGAVQNGGGWFDGGTNIFLSATSDNVAIGTTVPTSTLLVENITAVNSLRVNDSALDPSPFIVDANGNVGIGTTTANGSLIIPSGNVGLGTLNPVAGFAVMTGNVGIGTWSPERPFVIKGAYGTSAGQFLLRSTVGDAFIEIDSANTAEQAGIAFFQNTLRWEMYVPDNSTDFRFYDVADRLTLKSGGNIGIGTNDPVGGTAIMNGNVGIGTWSPSSKLEVKGGTASIISTGGTNTNATGAGELYVQGDLEVDGSIYGDGTNITGAIQNGGGWVDGGANIFLATTTDNVAIGTTAPTSTLLVENTTTVDSLRVNDAALDATPFIVDANGNVGIGTTTANGSLIIPSGNVGLGTLNPVAGLVVMSGNVGIGTWSPSSSFEIKGGDLRMGAGTFDNPSANEDIYITGNLEVDGTLFAPGIVSAAGWTDGGTNVFTTLTTDNVGIGTTTPTATLLIENVSAVDSLRVNDILLDPSPFLIDAAGNVGIGTTTAQGKFIIPSGNVGFGTLNPVAGLSVMTGNVGIGTWSPESRFVVVGTGSKLNFDDLGTTTISGTAGNFFGLRATVNGGTTYFFDADETALTLTNFSVSGGDYTLQSGATTTNFNIQTTVATTPIIFKPNSAEAMRITANGNVGIGTSGPNAKFVVESGNIGIGTTLPVAGTAIMNGNVGIGTWSPTSRLEVKGGDLRVGAGTFDNASAGDDAYVTGSLEIDGTLYVASSSIASAAGWTDGGTNIFTSTTTDTVGIGTTTPSTTLEIVKQSTNAPLMVSSSAAGDGDYVIVASSGNVGIGSVSPNAQMAIFQATPSSDALRLINADAGNLGSTLSFIHNSSSPAAFDEIGRVSFFANNDNPTRREFARLSVHNLDPSSGVEEGRYVFSVMRNGTLRDMISTSSSFVGINTSSPQATLSVNGSAVIGAGYAPQFPNTGNGIYVQGNTGIGTMAPASLLSVAGGATVGLTYARQVAPTDGLIVQGNVGIGTTAAAEKFVMPVGNMGIGTLNPVGGLIVMTGNAGIGTWSPIGRLEVRGGDLRVGSGTFDNASAGDDAYVTGNLEVDGTLYAASTSIASAAGWTDSGAIVYQSATTDFVGIGTTNPSTTLEILQQGTSPSLMVSSVFNGDGNLMIIHSGGNVGIGTVQPIAKAVIENTGAIDSFRVNDITADPAPFIIDQNGNVGIGTTTSVNTLSVNGAAAIGSGSAYETLTAPSNGLMVEGNVGIGTFVPGGTLEVITAASTIPFMVSSTSITNGDYLVVTSVGNVGVGTNAPNTKFAVIGGNVGIGTTLSNNNILSVNGGAYIAGNVGIGTLYPSGGGIMDIRQDEVRIWTGGGTVDNATAAGELYVEGDLEVDGTLYAASSSIASAAGWTDSGAIVYQTATTDFVGIGTTNPSTTLEILQQGTNPSLMISSVFNGDGNLMIIHSGGNVGIGTVQPIAKTVIENTGAIDSLRINDITADPTPFIIDQNGNVGIGTSTSATIVEVSSTAAQDLFRINDNGPADASPFVVNLDGNVGIGTAIPPQKLYITGVALATTAFDVGHEIISNTSASNSVNKTVTATCTAGKVIMGGGCDISDASTDLMSMGYPNSTTTFICNGREGDAVAGNWTVTAYAVCGRIQ